MIKIILASTSPRRQELLASLNLAFEIKEPLFDETPQNQLSPEEESLFFSKQKALSIAKTLDPSTSPVYVIGSDTLLSLLNQKIGKPQNPEHAFDILKSLRGKTHQILSALVILKVQDGDISDALSHLEKIEVQMKNYSDAEILDYLKLDQPWDKAGAYSIQQNGQKLMEKFEGEFEAAMGLPLKALKEFFEKELN